VNLCWNRQCPIRRQHISGTVNRSRHYRQSGLGCSRKSAAQEASDARFLTARTLWKRGDRLASGCRALNSARIGSAATRIAAVNEMCADASK
jgi:hypothetical protein